MRAWTLLVANLLRNKLRLCLMVLMIALAFCLLALFQATHHGLYANTGQQNNQKLIVLNKASASMALPLRYLAQISAIEGVGAVGYADWFGGYYQSPENQVPVLAIDEAYLAANPELILDPASRTNWLQARQGLLISQQLADKLGLQVGRQFTLGSAIWQRADQSSNQWDFIISGIYQVAEGSSMPASNLLMHYNYLNDVKQIRQHTVGAFSLLLSDPARYQQITRQIDLLFANSEAETKTMTLAAYAETMLGQLVNLNKVAALILGVVFATMLLVCASNIANSLRDRRQELALQLVIGFPRLRLMMQLMQENLLLLLTGCAVGYLLAWLVVGVLQGWLQSFLPGFGLQWPDLLQAGALVLLFSALVTIQPARAIRQMSLSEQLKTA
jgi:putative ABC transport system permease protein